MRDTPNGRAWVEELRSGQHLQGHGVLCARSFSGPRYCCLGVAYEFILRGDPEYKLLIPYTELPDVGIDGNEQSFCARMNDTYSLTFDQIADVLERAMDEGITVMEAHRQLLDEGKVSE